MLRCKEKIQAAECSVRNNRQFTANDNFSMNYVNPLTPKSD